MIVIMLITAIVIQQTFKTNEFDQKIPQSRQIHNSVMKRQFNATTHTVHERKNTFKVKQLGVPWMMNLIFC